MPRISRKVTITKRLQTELQATIAFSCYDSSVILQSGDSTKQATLQQQIYDLYMPVKSSDEEDDRMSEIELFLEGEGKFKYLFEIEKENVSHSASVSSTSNQPSLLPKNLLVLPEALHCIANKRVSVSMGCIDMALLTRKNLTNFVDISPLTLFRHAKDVEANFKKAYAMCVREDSPYKNYKGDYPSGHNRDSYLEWIREQMNDEILKIVLEDKIDEDAPPNETKDADADDMIDDSNKSDGKSNNTKNTNGKNSGDTYFKGYIAFSLWGFIPPPGGEELKSSIIHAIESPKRSADRSGGRIAKREKKEADKKYTNALEYRGTPKEVSDNNQQMNEIKTIIIDGRKESEKQKLFKCRTNKIEFDMRYCTERVKEIREEISELKEDAEDGEDTSQEIKDLKKELKSLRSKKKDLYERWIEINDEEDRRRSTIHTSTVYDTNTTISTKSTITSAEAPILRDIQFANRNKSNDGNSTTNASKVADSTIEEPE